MGAGSCCRAAVADQGEPRQSPTVRVRPRRLGDTAFRLLGDAATRRLGDLEAWRYGDSATGRWGHSREAAAELEGARLHSYCWNARLFRKFTPAQLLVIRRPPHPARRFAGRPPHAAP